jgi:putative DNA primase/helicase
MLDAIRQFQDAIRATGLQPPDSIVLGKLHRFPGIGKRKGNTAGWCKLFDDGLGGCFGDWSSGLSESWQAKRSKPYSRTERVAFAKQVESAKLQAAKELESRQVKAARQAADIWKTAQAAPSDNPYLVSKKIKAYGARLHNRALTLPILDFQFNITSLQFIYPDGGKRFLTGGRIKGCFIHVSGGVKNPSRVIISEGWATGCTLAEDEPNALVLAAVDAGNLKPVAIDARKQWSDAELVIAGDDDRLKPGNPGATKAREAAIESGALVAFPRWPYEAPGHLTDFNDLAVWLGGAR